MDSGAVLKEALASVRLALRDKGLRAKGMIFFRTADAGNVVLLAIQKSTTSTRARATVTLNYGVYCTLLGAKLQDDASASHDVTRAHWHDRLTENGQEKWIGVDASDSAAQCAHVILQAMHRVLAVADEHSTSEALRDEWLAGSSPGLTDMERLLFATILVNEIGPAERLGGLVHQLRASVAGGVHEGLVERRLVRAGVQVAR